MNEDSAASMRRSTRLTDFFGNSQSADVDTQAKDKQAVEKKRKQLANERAHDIKVCIYASPITTSFFANDFFLSLAVRSLQRKRQSRTRNGVKCLSDALIRT
jgi:hypothetical protein